MSYHCYRCKQDMPSSYCQDCHHATQPINDTPGRCTYHEREPHVQCVLPPAPQFDYDAMSDLLHVARQTAVLLNDSIKSMPHGWLCPACHKVNSPDVKQCPCDCGDTV